MNTNGQQDPLLTADAEPMLQQAVQKIASLELEIMTRDSIIDKLYRRVKELESADLAAKMNVEAPAN